MSFRSDGFALLAIVLFGWMTCTFGRQSEEPAPIHVRDNRNYDGKALTVPMSTEGGIAMHQRWMEQAFSGLFTAVALKRLPNLDQKKRDELAVCSRRSYDVIQHANCLKDILTTTITNRKTTIQERESLKSDKTSTSFIIDSHNNELSSQTSTRRLTKYGTLSRKFEHKRQKRHGNDVDDKDEILSRASYALKDGRQNASFSPLGSVAKFLTATILKSKNKTHADSWDVTINRIQKIVLKRKQEKKERERRRLQAAGATDGEYEPFRGLKEKEVEELGEALQDPKQLGNFLTAAKRHRQANRADVASRVSDLVREGVRVGFAIAGDNTTDFDRKTLKLVSPRFLSVVPEEVDNDNSTLNLLSPSLFSMHDRGRGLEKATSIASLSRDLSAGDRSAWLNLVMEAAGVSEQADRLEQVREINIAGF